MRILGRGGKVSGIRMIRMRLGDADDSGRRRPVPVPGSEFDVECDTVVPAIGQRPSAAAVQRLARLNRLEGVEADPVTGATSAAGVFAGGDCVTGGATVIEAIRAGQRAAVAIDRQLGGSGVLPANVGMSLRRPTEEDLEKLPAAHRRSLAVAGRAEEQLRGSGLRPEAGSGLLRGGALPALRPGAGREPPGAQGSLSMEEFKLTIDGRELSARPGQTVLQVALAGGIHIPHLCYDPRLTPTGACRLCLVEVAGKEALDTACTLAGRAGPDRPHRHPGGALAAQDDPGVPGERAQPDLHHLRPGRGLPSCKITPTSTGSRRTAFPRS